jgi:hypothetical protein
MVGRLLPPSGPRGPEGGDRRCVTVLHLTAVSCAGPFNPISPYCYGMPTSLTRPKASLRYSLLTSAIPVFIPIAQSLLFVWDYIGINQRIVPR